MYRLERIHKCKIVFGILSIVFLCLFAFGIAGGYEIINFDLMSETVLAAVLVTLPICALICVIVFLILNALEKDISEWLKKLDNWITK